MITGDDAVSGFAAAVASRDYRTATDILAELANTNRGDVAAKMFEAAISAHVEARTYRVADAITDAFALERISR